MGDCHDSGAGGLWCCHADGSYHRWVPRSANLGAPSPAVNNPSARLSMRTYPTRQPDPLVILGVTRVWNSSTRAIVSFLPPCQAPGAGRAHPGLGRQQWHMGLQGCSWACGSYSSSPRTAPQPGFVGQEVRPHAQLRPSIWGSSPCVFVPVPSVCGVGVTLCRLCCAKAAGMGTALGAGEGLGRGELGFESVEQCCLVGRCFPQRKSKFGSTGPDCKLAERERQENQQHWAARTQLSRG